MQQQDDDQDQTQPQLTRMRPHATRLIKHSQHFLDESEESDVAARPTNSIFGANRPDMQVEPFEEQMPNDVFDVSILSTAHLMRLSGMMRAVHVPPQTPGGPAQDSPVVGEYWPDGIHQTGPLPVANLYGREPFGRVMPPPDVMPQPVQRVPAKPMPKWKAILGTPAAKVIIGLIVGVGLLFLTAKFIDIGATINIIKTNLITPRGITFALLAGVCFMLAFIVRGIRWKLFLNPIGKVSTIKAIQLFLIGIFLNFLLPIRGGEVAKSLMLKRTANIPVSQSLPTVAMDKALDLMPALFIMAIVPFLGIKMSVTLWLVLGAVGSILLILIFFIALAAWKRSAAMGLMQRLTGMLPKSLSSKVEGFATGFIDALLAGASQPRIFVPAILLTVVAVTFDGLFAMLCFWTIGFNIAFGTAIFGYTVYNMFYILPTPPGQVGSNQIIGVLVFHGLLGVNEQIAGGMFIFSHPWAALIMTVSAMICLSSLGLTISSAMKVQTSGSDNEVVQEPMPEAQAVRA